MGRKLQHAVARRESVGLSRYREGHFVSLVELAGVLSLTDFIRYTTSNKDGIVITSAPAGLDLISTQTLYEVF